MTSTNASSRAPRSRLPSALLLVISILGATLLGALPASAITPTGLGTGHLSNGDQASWLGTYPTAGRTLGLLPGGPQVVAARRRARHRRPDAPAGVKGIKAAQGDFFTAFPDVDLAMKTLVADDERVTAVFTISGTQTGTFQGHKPTGRSFTGHGIQVGRFDDDGMLVEHWGRRRCRSAAAARPGLAR